MRRLLTTATAVALALALAACGSGGASPAGSPPASSDPNAPVVTARDIAFTTSTVTVAAGKPVQLVFDNEDGAPHNLSIAADDGFSNVVFKGEIFAGPSKKTYSLPALTAGTYHFRCDVHPNMTGTIVAS